MTPKNPESFMTVSRAVSEIFGILLSDPVTYLQKETTRTESLDTPPQLDLMEPPVGAFYVLLVPSGASHRL